MSTFVNTAQCQWCGAPVTPCTCYCGKCHPALSAVAEGAIEMNLRYDVRPDIVIGRILRILARAVVKVACLVIGLVFLAGAVSLETSGLADLVQMALFVLGGVSLYLFWRIPLDPQG